MFLVVFLTRAFMATKPLAYPIGVDSVYVSSSIFNQSIYSYKPSNIYYWYGQRLCF